MPNNFLANLLVCQKLDTDQEDELKKNRDEVEELLKDKIGTKPTIRYGGSKAKNTMIKESYDLDIVCYFPYDDKQTLKEIFENIASILNEKYIIEEKTSALRIKYLKNGIIKFDYHIDVVPGKFVKEDSYDCYLYISNFEGERIKTNIEEHISHISESNCRDLIKLAKLWKARNSIQIRTFILEIFIVKIFEKYERIDLKHDFVYFLESLEDKIDKITLMDPANSRDVSDLLSLVDKAIIKQNVRESLNLIKINDDISDDIESWYKLFDEIYQNNEKQEEIVSKDSRDLSIQNYSHRESPKWLPIKNSTYKVNIEAYLYSGSEDTPEEKRKKLSKYNSDSRKVVSGLWIKFLAKTNVPTPFNIYWQVVNTGGHAKKMNGLRGNIFPGTLDLKQWERTFYTGIHWIECYIIKDDICYARDRFYVKIKNSSWYS